ncbi:predicted protein [Chaetoceros tenuissimus]|nr:predicted protein [Chaetoceros tenuissimus]
MEDLQVFLDSISTLLDTDGSIGAMCILMLSCLLLLNPMPASAKENQQGKDLTVFSYSRPNEIIEDFPKGFSNMCFNFPQENEIVDVFFGYARAINVDEDTCSFTAVSTMDDSTSVNVKSFHINNILNASGAALGFLFREVYGRNNWIKSTLEEERKKSEAAASLDTPPEIGSFQGVSFRKMSRNSSNKRMTIKRKLNFETNGSIVGSGFDPIDGSFEIKGSWRKVGNEYKLRWKEMYDEKKIVEIMDSKHWYKVKQKYDVEVEGTLFEGEEF